MKHMDLEHKFMETFQEYADAIFRFCLVKVSNKPLAEDMTQEVFMRYWQYVREGKEITNARSLLYTIANNLAKDWYKKKKPIPLEEDNEHSGVLTARESSAETLAAYQEVIDTISDMEPTDREVLLLSYVEGLEPKEIALLSNETANVISVRLHRATARLKQKLHV